MEQSPAAEASLAAAPALSQMAIGSVDTLRGHEISLAMPDATWNDQPPLLDRRDARTGERIPETARLLKGLLRHGIPPALRCAVQLSNVMQAVHPHQSPEEWHAYRTLAKVRALDAAYESLLRRMLRQQQQQQASSPQLLPHGNSVAPPSEQELDDNHSGPPPTDEQYDAIWNSLDAPSYGRQPPVHADIATLIPGITPQGALALRRVLLALEQVIGGTSGYAPLVPVLTAVLLTHLSESYAFAAVRAMGHTSTNYFPVSRPEHAAWCSAFGDVLRKLHAQTAEYLEDRGVLDVDGLTPLLGDFLVGILPLKYVQRILDIYTLEGMKVLFRFGVALLVLYKKESAEQLVTISNAKDWWDGLRTWAHNPRRFHFEFVVRKAYGVHGRGLRRQMRFPRRAILQRIVRMEEDRIRADESLDENGRYSEPPARPLGLVPQPPPAFGEEQVRAVLAQSVQARQHIAQWLPLTLRLTNLDLLFSTNYHGRTLERFYAHLKNVRHSLLLCEVLQAAAPPTTTTTTSSSSREGEQQELPQRTIVGMYASQPWHISTQVYGDGACFLFRLQPNPQCWKWSPRRPGDGGRLLDQVDLESDNNNTALLEQFMVGTRSYISMGGNPDGSSGLRLNEDLTRGESSPAVGFENEPLHGMGRGSVFEVGVVEVYGLVRQIDGRAVCE